MDFSATDALQFIVGVLFVALLAVLYFIGWYLKVGRKKTKLIKDATAALLRSQMLQICNECKKRGFTTIEDMHSFQCCYKPYHALGFNDVGDKLNREMQALPFKSDGSD